MEPMRPAAWRLFVELADLGSITKVALARNLAQSQVSRQLAELEAQCGGRLFLRTGRGIALSELGGRVIPRIRAWLAETDQLASDIRTGGGVPVGEVRVAILPSASHPLASTVFRLARERYPLVRLSIREGQGSQIDDWLEGGRVDLAVRYAYEKALGEDDRVLMRADTYLVGPKGDALTRPSTVPFARLRGMPLILPCKPSAWRDTLDATSRRLGFALNVVVEADSLMLQNELVASGAGHTILGPFAIEGELRAGRLQASRIVDPALRRVVALTARRGGNASLAARAVAQLIEESAGNLAGLSAAARRRSARA